MESKPGLCTIAPDDEVFERYLRDELSEEQREAFELHYLECAGCQETLETYRAITRELAAARQAPAAARPAAVPRTYAPTMWGLAAAAVLVAAVVIQRRGPEPVMPEQAVAAPPSSAPAPALPAAPPAAAEPAANDRDAIMLLARFDPPTYTAPALRRAETNRDATFRQAMAFYTAADYAAARSALESVVAADPQAPGANFFLAITHLLQDRTNEGIAGLRRTIALGDTAYLEDSRFYLGKSLVRAGDLAGAERELQAVVAMDGDRRGEAAAMVTQLRHRR
jgi:TolA-binding protein